MNAVDLLLKFYYFLVPSVYLRFEGVDDLQLVGFNFGLAADLVLLCDRVEVLALSQLVFSLLLKFFAFGHEGLFLFLEFDVFFEERVEVGLKLRGIAGLASAADDAVGLELTDLAAQFRCDDLHLVL